MREILTYRQDRVQFLRDKRHFAEIVDNLARGELPKLPDQVQLGE